MNATPPHLALREWRRKMVHPITLSVMAAVAVVMAVVGPFDTESLLQPVMRLAYWALVVVGTFGTGLAVALILDPRLDGRMPHWLAIGVQGVVTGLAIAPVLFVLTAAFFPGLPPLRQLLGLAAQGVVIAVVVTAVIAAVSAQLQPARATTGQPALLARLPLERRGAIWSLSAEDHYTRIRTSAGDALVLIRLSDAITLAAPTQGIRIHRSHWVAVAAVQSVRRQGDGALVRLSDGTELPASRRHIPSLRDAGLLPR